MYYTKALELARILHQDSSSSSSSSISSLASSEESHSTTSNYRRISSTTSNDSSSSTGASANTDASRRSLSASIAGNLGVTASDLGRDEEAQQWYEQSALELDLDWNIRTQQQKNDNKRKTLQKTPQQLNVAKTWNNLGTLYAKQGDYNRARQYFENALDQYFVSLAKGHSRSAFSSTLLPNRVKQCPDVAFTYHNLGHLCLQHDRLEEAAVFLETALEIHQYCCCHESGKPNTRAAFVTMRTTLETMGELCVELGRFSKAIEFYHQVLSLQQHQPKRDKDKEHNKKPDSEAVDAVVRTTTLGILGVLYFELGNYTQAKEVLEEAVVAFLRQQQLQKSSAGVDDLAGTFDYLSRTEAKLGHPQRARRYERQSLRLLSKNYGRAAC